MIITFFPKKRRTHKYWNCRLFTNFS